MDRRVKAAASQFLVAALAEARRQRIIPDRRRRGRWERSEGPWPAFWGCWEIARSPISAALQAALREAYPGRFGIESKFPYKDPEEYVRAFLRAAIAQNVIYGRGVSSRSPASRAAIEELERVATMEGQEFACLWVISDVDFEAVDQQSVGRVTLIPQRSPPEDAVSRILPEALWVGDGYPLPGAKRQGLLHALDVGSGHHWDVTRPLNDAIARFVTILRLATATTSVERVVWVGESSMIHIAMPEEHPHHHGFMESHWRRVAKLSSSHVEGLAGLTRVFDGLDPDDPKKPLPAIVVAMRRYSRSFRTATWQDTVLDLATALEACLGPSSKEEIGLTLRLRAAHLLAHDDSQQAEAIYTDVKDLYDLRSDIIHGNAKLRRDLGTLWAARAYQHVLESDRLHVLLDRWREIVRRAICARLMLGDDRLGSPLWPLKRAVGAAEVPVDLALVRRDRRDGWRERIVATAQEYGLPLLAEPAPPLIDYLHHDPREADEVSS